MQTLRSVYISAAEWRWVIVISGLLVALTIVPYAWALAQNQTASDWQFMGMLANPKDGATYLAKMEQGRQGSWLFELRHTPQKHDGAAFHTFYLFLGHAARVLGLSSLVTFHLVRMATSFFMYLSLYQLGATVWIRQRPRRLFFVLSAVGAGLGWLVVLFDPKALAPDLAVPEAFPFYASFANPHFPLSIACLALIASAYLVVFRRGYTDPPSVENGGLGVLLLSVTLALIQPTALIPFAGALVLYVGVRAWITREVPQHELRWASMLWLPIIPFAVYDYAVFHFNTIMGEFNAQNETPSPAPWLLLAGYGLLLVVALPGLLRAVRHFERDGDQLMLLWLIVNVVALYAPFNLQRRLMMGLILPLVYFAVRSLEDSWFYRVPARWRSLAFILLLVFLVPSNILVLGIPLFGAVANPDSGLETGLLVETGYWQAMEWLRSQGEPDAVVLAAPNVSLWIPAYTRQVVVYGHPFETVPADERLQQVERFYRGQDCVTLLSDDLPFRVRYVLWGPQERTFGAEDDDGHTYPDAGKCVATLPPERIEGEVNEGDVTIYVLR
jgi:hypothetical protein